MAPDSDGDTGINERAIADGRCVKTMVLIRPIRLAREAATKDEIEDRMPATKNRVPRSPGCRLNFWLKK